MSNLYSNLFEIICSFIGQDVNNMFLGTQSMYESPWIMGMATMKRVRNRRGSALPNPKKMYEEAQMVRRVKSYLSNIKVIYDEDKLRDMSYQCEPDTKGKTGFTCFLICRLVHIL